ncbi:hypothetical protein Gotri_016983 [Gossypium trilobum]|uniref:Uncharacterized protein n=1 Tax=Gossypium trilobum TaxID=34281 RepID=A0A7J9E547_9ROSI|nr:hypothetical protein [Gossypium trilobum]
MSSKRVIITTNMGTISDIGMGISR